MVAGDNRPRDSSAAGGGKKNERKRQYCGRAGDGQVPQAQAVFYSHLDSRVDNVLARQLACVAHEHKTKAKQREDDPVTRMEIIAIVSAQPQPRLVYIWFVFN